jgi:Rrf2 family protein
MKLSRTVAYAMQATLQLAQSDTDSPVPCSQLATAGNMPERFLLQILRHLVNHGILQSTRGVDGGYSLSRKAEKISLLEIIEAIDGPLVTELPAMENAKPSTVDGRLKRVLDDVTHNCRRQLDAVKLADLLGKVSLTRS